MNKNKFRFSYPAQIGVAVVAGITTGLVFGTRVQFLGDAGLVIIQILKTLAAPLVFFAIVDGFCKIQLRLKSAFHLLTLSAVNAVVAGLIALSVSMIFEWIPLSTLTSLRTLIASSATPNGKNALDSAQHTPLSLPNIWSSLIPHNVLEPFLNGNMLSIILVSLFMGIAIKRLKRSHQNAPRSAAQTETALDLQSLERFFSGGLRVTSAMLHVVVSITPLAVFGVIAKIVGSNGFQIFSTLGIFVSVVALGIFIHGALYYSVLLAFVGRVSPFQFFASAKEALLTAFGTGSSVATLPVTLDTLKTMKVSDESSRLAAVIGTNLNHDGILLYEAVAALFVAHLHGISILGSQKILLLVISTLAAVGIAGVPDAGLITLSLVLSTLDLPLTLVPVLLAVDWFLGRLRATVNVTSDMVVATLLDRWK